MLLVLVDGLGLRRACADQYYWRCLLVALAYIGLALVNATDGPRTKSIDGLDLRRACADQYC